MSGSLRGHAAEPRSIDLNADLGEGFTNDRALLKLVTSASICCGGHAGSPAAIRETLRDAVASGVCIGAHPGYPDRENFGRREQRLTVREVSDLVQFQIESLFYLAAEVKAKVRYLKPHGALYNQAQRETDVASAVVATSLVFGLPLLGQPGSLIEKEARDRGVVYIAEGFPDRRYRADGSLAPRSEPGALLREPQEIEEQAIRLLLEGRVATLCIHGDEPGAVATAEVVRQILERHEIEIRSFAGGSG
jgi:UPF0271 protein